VVECMAVECLAVECLAVALTCNQLHQRQKEKDRFGNETVFLGFSFSCDS